MAFFITTLTSRLKDAERELSYMDFKGKCNDPAPKREGSKFFKERLN
jgi:hypothetical protein